MEINGSMPLARMLKAACSAREKLILLNEDVRVGAFLQSGHPLLHLLNRLPIDSEVVLKQLIAIEQAPLACKEFEEEALKSLLKELGEADRFYQELGGLVGYQSEVERCLKRSLSNNSSNESYLSPMFVDISKWTAEVEQSFEAGISALPHFAEFYPLGGAADRLHLIDEQGNEQPAARLQFAGRTLLEGLLRDLQSREALYFQKTQKVLTTPVAIMTSKEKGNWKYVQEILEQNNWFGRPKHLFRLFIQPLVPVVDQTGRWMWGPHWKLSLKPGGHGAIWKLAHDYGVFDWLESLGIRYALIRQINNPLAGLDYGLLAFAGTGVRRKASFGFASCPRLLQAAEGMNVMIERKSEQGHSYVISNVEYCEFTKCGVKDEPLTPNQPYSRFTSNTNILFVDLPEVKKAVERCPYPGLLINLKQDATGTSSGRLESTMQNLAECFAEDRKEPPSVEGLSKTFVTYNERLKTISTAKKAFVEGARPNETPEHCFYDLMRARRILLRDHCFFTLSEEKSLEDELKSFPSFVFLYHPALGPLFKTIGQKLQGGFLKDGSELELEIAESFCEEVHVDGSLRILAKWPLGIQFGSLRPRCILSRVQVVNRGVDWERSRPFWKASYQRRESVEVILEGYSEFVAKDVCFRGSWRFVVPDGERIIVFEDGDSLKIVREQMVFGLSPSPNTTI